jgi:O-antigen ligase
MTGRFGVFGQPLGGGPLRDADPLAESGSGPLSVTRGVADWQSRTTLVGVLVALAAGLALAAGVFVATGRPAIAVGAAAALPVLAWILRYPFGAVLIWILAMPFFIQVETTTPHPAFYVVHRLMILAVLGLVLVYHGIGQFRTRLRPSMVDVAILVFLGLGVANVLLLADNPARMMIAFYDRLIVPFLMFWLIRAIDPGQRDIQRLAIVGAIAVGIQAAIGILSWVAPAVLPPAWLGRAGERTVGTFGAPGPFTITLVFFGLLAAHYALGGIGRRPRALLLAVFAGAALAVFLSFQRGGWLGALVGIVGLWLVYPRTVYRLVLAGIVVAVLLAIGPLRDEFTFASERLGVTTTVTSRLVTFDAAIQMVEAEPLRGFGYGQFEKFDEQFKRTVGDVAYEAGGSLHNSWLGLAAENGIPAVLLYILPAVILFVRSVRTRTRLSRHSFLGGGLLIIAWAGVLDVFVVSNTMDMFHSSAWGTTLAWIGLALIAVQVDRVVAGAPRAGSRILAGIRHPTPVARVRTGAPVTPTTAKLPAGGGST